MAAVEKSYLDFNGLQTYDSLIKAEIPEPDGTTIITDENGKLKALASGSIPTVSNTTLVMPYALNINPTVTSDTLIFP